MKCPYCDRQIGDKAKTCPYCKAAVTKSKKEEK